MYTGVTKTTCFDHWCLQTRFCYDPLDEFFKRNLRQSPELLSCTGHLQPSEISNWNEGYQLLVTYKITETVICTGATINGYIEVYVFLLPSRSPFWFQLSRTKCEYRPISDRYSAPPRSSLTNRQTITKRVVSQAQALSQTPPGSLALNWHAGSFKIIRNRFFFEDWNSFYISRSHITFIVMKL